MQVIDQSNRIYQMQYYQKFTNKYLLKSNVEQILMHWFVDKYSSIDRKHTVVNEIIIHVPHFQVLGACV